MTARERANIRWGMTTALGANIRWGEVDPSKVRVLYVMHERGCHGRKRHNRTCACWREAFKMLAADPDLILSDGTRGGIK